MLNSAIEQAADGLNQGGHNQHDKEGQAHAGKRFLRGKCFLFHNDAPSWSDRNIDAVALLLCRCNQIPGLHGRPDDAHKENGRPF